MLFTDAFSQNTVESRSRSSCCCPSPETSDPFPITLEKLTSVTHTHTHKMSQQTTAPSVEKGDTVSGLPTMNERSRWRKCRRDRFVYVVSFFKTVAVIVNGKGVTPSEWLMFGIDAIYSTLREEFQRQRNRQRKALRTLHQQLRLDAAVPIEDFVARALDTLSPPTPASCRINTFETLSQRYPVFLRTTELNDGVDLFPPRDVRTSWSFANRDRALEMIKFAWPIARQLVEQHITPDEFMYAGAEVVFTALNSIAKEKVRVEWPPCTAPAAAAGPESRPDEANAAVDKDAASCAALPCG